eukprot:CAMPEP_0180539150 /NCGR_PEP_ID=MMETSP1036_2-20121128/66738_1 /TAXON_ID=632150 /ORGANISM="Azadinium spinosum, Strain 3D9" /LENGTH=48 /DNA_ID= /DNA_START= /DNA_END= /DNA_ORIENTATION=
MKIPQSRQRLCRGMCWKLPLVACYSIIGANPAWVSVQIGLHALRVHCL